MTGRAGALAAAGACAVAVADPQDVSHPPTSSVDGGPCDDLQVANP
jgi:hypothetical protein